VTKEESVIYGVNPVRESLRSETAQLEKIYFLPGKGSKDMDEIRTLAKQRRIALISSQRIFLDRMAGTPKHQGIVAVLAVQPYLELEPLIEAAQRGPKPPFLFLIDGVEDPRNLGAIIRTVDAAGGNGIVIPSRRAVGLTPVVAKTSAGALAHLPVARVTNLAAAIEMLKTAGFWIVGLDVEGKTPYVKYDFTGPIAIVVGGEGKGIRRGVLEHCDDTVVLPMLGRVSSLNVAIAVGIVAYEVVRQRQGNENVSARKER